MKSPKDILTNSIVRLIILQTIAGVALTAPATWTALMFASRYLNTTANHDPLAFVWLVTGLACLEALVFCPVIVAPITFRLHRLVQSQARLERLADTDALTGLLNRRGLDKAEERLLRRPSDGTMLAALVFDLDHFKSVNDRHGHAFGDEALRSLGRLLAERFDGEAAAARIGGEEFVALLPVRNPRAAAAAAEGLRRVFAEREVRLGDSVDRCTLSVGVAVASSPGDLRGLILRADDALYRAKFSGRNRVAFAVAA